MRLLILFCCALCLVQCTKHRRLKQLKGVWKLEKILHVNGAFDTTVSEAYSFTRENASGGNYQLINQNKDSVFEGRYEFQKMGSKLILYKGNSEAKYRHFVIEDMDKNQLIMVLEREIYFLKKN